MDNKLYSQVDYLNIDFVPLEVSCKFEKDNFF